MSQSPCFPRFSPATAANDGSLDPTFIKCMNDFIIRPATLRYLIDRMNAAYPDNPMDVDELEPSHEALRAHPKEVTGMLLKVADRVGERLRFEWI